MTVPLSPVLAAATRLMHGDYDTTLASRRQREIDVQEVAGGLILLAARLEDVEARLREAEEVVGMSLPALGLHPRGFSQEALIRACKITGGDPADWTHFPDVLEQRRKTLGLDVPEGGQ